MLRMLLALFLATIGHLLIFQFPLPKRDIQPELMGNSGIKVRLQTISISSPPPAQQPVKKLVSMPEPDVVEKTVLLEKISAPIIKTKTTKKRRHIINKTPDKTSNPSTKTSQQAEETKTDNRDQLQSESQPQTAIIKAAPLYHKNPKPEYPSLARRRNWQGTVIVTVVVSEEGTVKEVQIHQSSGYSILDKSALQTLRSWQFVPGKQNGTVSEMQVLVPIHFKMNKL